MFQWRGVVFQMWGASFSSLGAPHGGSIGFGGVFFKKSRKMGGALHAPPPHSPPPPHYGKPC